MATLKGLIEPHCPAGSKAVQAIPPSEREQDQEGVAVETMVVRHVREDGGQRADSKRRMPGDRDVVLAVPIGREPQVTARLPGMR